MMQRLRDRLPRKVEEEERKEFVEKAGFERKDFWAMLIAAFLTLWPFVLVLVGLVFGLVWLLFAR